MFLLFTLCLLLVCGGLFVGLLFKLGLRLVFVDGIVCLIAWCESCVILFGYGGFVCWFIICCFGFGFVFWLFGCSVVSVCFAASYFVCVIIMLYGVWYICALGLVDYLLVSFVLMCYYVVGYACLMFTCCLSRLVSLLFFGFICCCVYFGLRLFDSVVCYCFCIYGLWILVVCLKFFDRVWCLLGYFVGLTWFSYFEFVILFLGFECGGWYLLLFLWYVSFGRLVGFVVIVYIECCCVWDCLWFVCLLVRMLLCLASLTGVTLIAG